MSNPRRPIYATIITNKAAFIYWLYDWAMDFGIGSPEADAIRAHLEDSLRPDLVNALGEYFLRAGYPVAELPSGLKIVEIGADARI
jgi:hypothetical protein